MLATLAAFMLAAFQPGATPSEPTTQKPAEPAAKAAEEEKICRYIRKDMSSRRKDKVCLTAEQWKEQNQGE